MPDLTDLPGLPDLWACTRGDSRITIALLDGPVDLERACFRGARLTRHTPYWQEASAIDPQDLAAFLAVENSPDDDDETKAAKLEVAIPDAARRGRLRLAFHATHIASTIFGQPGSAVEGIAPHCT